MFNQNLIVMRKHLFRWMLLLVAFAVPWVTHAQVTVEIGDPSVTTVNEYLPMYSYYNYSYTEQIYTAEEIGMPGSITSIAFKNSGTAYTRTCSIYMAHTTKETFTSSSDWVVMSASDLVYSGTITLTSGSWTTITLDSPFQYDGASNLVIAVNDNTGDYEDYMSVLSFSAANQALYIYNDDDPYSISSPGSGTRASTKNQIHLEIIPSGAAVCLRPNPATVIPSATAASFTWTAVEGAISYEYLYLEADGTPDWESTDVQSTTSTSAEFTGLESHTSYVAYVRTQCGVGDYSTALSVPFTTPCGSIVVTAANPYTEGFEDYTGSSYSSNGVIPDCWNAYSTASVSPHVIGSGSYYYVHNGSKALTFYGSGSNYAVLPPFENDINSLQISFWYQTESASYGTLTVGYITADDQNMNTYQELATFPRHSGSMVEVTNVSLADAPANAARIVFKWEYSSQWSCCIDDITVAPLPDCRVPMHVAVSGVTTDEAVVSWTAALAEDNTWEVEYSTDGTTWSTTQSINDNPVTLMQLQPNTDYQVRVRTICGTEEMSDWSDVVSFRTECVGLTEDDLPYVQDFDQSATGTSSNSGNFVECWKSRNSADATYVGYPYVYSSSTYATTGSQVLYFYAASATSTSYPSNQTAVLPALDPSVPTNTVRLAFSARAGSASYNAQLQVGVMTDPNDMTTFTPLQTIALTAAHTLYTIPFDSYEGTGAYVAIRCPKTATSTTGVYVDHVVLDLIPSCFEVSNLTVGTVNAEDVSLTWTDMNNNTPASWTVAYGEEATFDLTDDMTYATLTTYDPEAIIPNLTPYTAYSFAVKANCNATESSVWSQVVSTTTMPDCTPLSARVPVTGTGTSSGYTYGFYASTSYARGANWMVFNEDEMAAFDLYEGEIRGIALRYAGTADITMPVKIYLCNSTKTAYSSSSDTTSRANMTLVYDGDANFLAGGVWSELQFTTPFTYTGGGVELLLLRNTAVTANRTFYYNSGSGYRTVYRYGSTGLTSGSYTSSRADVRFTMCVNEPSCLGPLDFARTVTGATEATFTWINRSNAENWQMRVGTTILNITADDLDSFEGDTVTFTLSDLTPNTEYTVELRSKCGDQDFSDWTQAITFTTQCEPLAITEAEPFTEGFETYTGTTYSSNGEVPDCWESSSTGSVSPHVIGSGSYYYVHNGSKALTFYGSGINYAVLPPFENDLNSLQISFWYQTESSSNGNLTLGYILQGDVNMGTFTPISTFPRHYGSMVEVDPIYLTSLPADAARLVFKWEYSGQYSCCIDDITVSVLPTCLPLTDLTVEGTPGIDEVSLTWNHMNEARPVQYLVEYTVEGDANAVSDTAYVNYTEQMDIPGTANGIRDTLSGLTPNTPYSVRVAAVCSVGDTGEWSPAISFRTGCSTFELPYTTGFEVADINSATNMPFCWDRYNSEDLTTSPAAYAGASHLGSRSLRFLVNAGGASTQLAVMPQISDLFPMNGNRLVFWLRAGSELDSALTVGVMTDPTDPTTFTPVANFNATTTYTKYKLSLAEVTAGNYVALRGNRPTSGTSDISVYVDDVTLELQPGCETPEGFAVKPGKTSASQPLCWIDGEGDTWQIQYTHTVDNEPVENTLTISANDVVRGTVNSDSVFYTLTGLDAYTQYTLKLRTVCGDNSSAWSDNTINTTTLNNATDITAFTLTGQFSSEIDAVNHTVNVLMPHSTDLTAVGGTFAMSFGATADTNGGSFQTTIASATDFSSPLTIHVTAQDAAFSSNWTINVANESCARPVAMLIDNVGKYSFDLELDRDNSSEGTDFQYVLSEVALDAAALAAAQPVNFVYDGTELYTIDHLRYNTTYYLYVRANCGNGDYSGWLNATVTTRNMGYSDCDVEGPTMELLSGTGTSTTQYVAWSDFYNSSYTQQIFTADELHNMGLSNGTITKIAFRYALSASYTKTVSLYLGTTANTEFTSTTFIPMTDLTEVMAAQSTVFNTSGQWYEFEFDEPFYWDGTSSLVVAMMAMGTNYPSSGTQTFYGGAQSQYRSVYSRTDSGTPSTTSGTSRTYNRADIRFSVCGAEEACPAPVLTNVSVTGAGTNTALATWEPATGDWHNTYNLVVVAHGAGVESTPVFAADDIDATSVTQAISGLMPYTEYDVYLNVACNADGYNNGVSEWSTPYTFRTNSDCREPVAGETVLVSRTEAQVNWTNGSIEAGEVMQASNFEYGYFLQPQNEILVSVAGFAGNAAEGTASVSLTNLIPDSTYYFYVANRCPDNSRSPFTLITFTMPEPCAAPTGVQAMAVGKYNATLDWMANYYNGSDVLYEVYYDSIPLTEEQLATQGPNLDQDAVVGTSAMLTLLKRATTYYAYVRTDCGEYGTSAWSEPCVFTTEDLGFDCSGDGASVIVANGTTTNSYVPLYGLYMDENNHSQSIYPASMLTGLQGRQIRAMKYFVSSGSSSGSNGEWSDQTITVKLMETTATSVSSSFVSTTAATTVYTGTLSASTSTGMVVTFNEPFTYNGGNLLIDFSSVTDGDYSSCYFYGVSSTGSSRNGYGSSVTTQNFLPKIEFTTCAVMQACPVVELTSVTEVTHQTATLNWTASEADHVDSYEIIVSENAITDFTDMASTYEGITDPFYTIIDLEPNTDYYVYVRVNCNTEDYEDGYSVWSPGMMFHTELPCVGPRDFQLESLTSHEASIVWHRGDLNNTSWNIFHTEMVGGEEIYTLDTVLTENDVEFFGENLDSVRFTLTNLASNTRYPVSGSYSIETNCGVDGNSLSTGDLFFRTLNDSAQFTSFLVHNSYPNGPQIGDAEINANDHTVNITVLSGWNLANLYQVWDCSFGVSRVLVDGVAQTNGTPADFTEPRVYTLYAEDTNYTEVWTVTVSYETCASPVSLTATPARVTADLAWQVGDENALDFDMIVSDTAVVDFSVWTPMTVTAEAEGVVRTYTLTGLERDSTYYVYLRNHCAEDWTLSQNVTFTTLNLDYCTQLGTGTSSSTLISTSWGNTYSQHIYTAAELHEMGLSAGSIVGVSFDFSGTSSTYDKTQSVYIGTTTLDAFAGSAYSYFVPASDLTLAYGPTLNSYQAGWRNYAFSQPFEWDGVSNIVVAMLSNGNHTSASGWSTRGTSVGVYRTIYRYQDNTFIDITDLGASTSGSSSYSQTRPNIQFCFLADGCPAVESAEALLTGDGTTTATLNWAVPDADYLNGYEVIVSDTAMSETGLENATAHFTPATNTLSLENLIPYHNYYVYIRANCMLDADHDDGYSPWYGVQFRTNSSCHTADNLTATLTDRNAVHFSWDNDQNSAVQYVLSTQYDLSEAELALLTPVDLEATDTLDLDELDFFQPYTLYVRHNCGDDDFSPWQSVSFQTLEECLMVEDVTVTPYFNAAVIAWENAQFSNSTSWHIEIAQVDNNQYVTVFDSVVTSNPFTVTGLQPESSYEMGIYAICGDQESEVYNDADFTTPAVPGDCAQLGNGTTSAYLLYTSYGNTYSQHIYTAAELQEMGLSAGSIVGVSFDFSGTSSSYDKTQSVYIGTTTLNAFASSAATSFVPSSDMTLAYGPTLNSYQAGWRSYDFNQPFEWDGVSNIVVGMLSNSSATTSSGWSVRGTNVGAYRTIYRYRDSSPIDIDNLSAVSYGSYSLNRPNIKFCFEPSDCHDVRNMHVANVEATSASVTWLPGSTETQWNMVVSTTELDEAGLTEATAELVTDVNQVLTGLTADADYYVYVQPICDATDELYGDWVMAHFITVPTCSAPVAAVAQVNGNDVTFVVAAGENGVPASYTYEYWVVGNEDQAISGTADDTTWTLTLEGGVQYGWRVRANCGDNDGDSRWTNGNSFFVCGAIVVTETTPFVEDFTVPGRLNCWFLGNNGDTYTTNEEEYTQWAYGSIYGAVRFVQVDANYSSPNYYGDVYLATPAIQVLPTEGHVNFSFTEYIEYAEDYGQNTIYLMPEGSTDFSDAVVLWNPATVENGEFDRTISLDNYLGQTFRLVFKYEGEYAHSWFLNNIAVTMDPAYQVIASAAQTADDRGEVALQGETTSDGRYYNGLGVTLTATANEGYEFVNWTNADNEIVSTDSSWTLHPTCDTVLYANFDTASYTLTALVSSMQASMGTVALDGVAPANGNTSVSATVKYLTEHTLTATANTHYTFVKWNDEVTDNPRTVVMPANDLSLRAIFDAETTYTEQTLEVCDSYTLRRSDNSVVNVYTQSGTYTPVYDDPEDGRIALTLTLTVNQSSHTATYETACDSYTWTAGNGLTYNQSADVVYEYNNTANCPSADTLHLIVNNSSSYVLTEPQVACDSYRYTFSDQTQSEQEFTESNDAATLVITNAAGCDSTITFALTINHSNTGSVQASACDTYTWTINDQLSRTYTFDVDGENVTDTYTTTNAAGCDSVTTLTLTLASSANLGGETTTTVCDGIMWRGAYRDATGDYSDVVSVGTCSGTYVLHLTVNHNSNTGFRPETAACDSYTWHRTDGTDTVITETVNGLTYNYTSVEGCPSTDTLFVVVNHNTSTAYRPTDDPTAVACDNYTWYHTDGTYEVLTTSVSDYHYEYVTAQGCPSVDTLYLTLSQSQRNKNIIINCGPYTWSSTGLTYGNSATYYHNGFTEAGCLIRDTLVLTVNPNVYGIDQQTACDSMEWHGTMYYANTNTPTYSYIGLAGNGCDSVVTLNLTVNHATHQATPVTACDSYTWTAGNNQTYNQSVDVVYEFTNAQLCASTDTLHLTVNYSNTGDTTATACDNFIWHGTNYTATPAVAPTYTMTNTAGCDSVVTLHLAINASSATDTTATACDSFTWHGQNYTATPAVAPTYTTTNLAGCDSVVTLHLTINVSTTGDTTAMACETFTWHGTNYTATPAVAPTFTMENQAGCDSVVTLHLTIVNAYATDTTATACDNFTWYGTNYTATPAVAPTHTFESVLGCDSVVTLHLTINVSTTGDTTAVACESFTWHGTTYTATPAEAPTFTMENLAGCDSVVTLHLTINTATTGDTTAVACGSFTWYGTTYTESTETATHTLVNLAGCDSVVTLHLTISNSTTGDTTATACDSFTWYGTTYTESTETPTHTFTNLAGCDSVVTLHLTVRYSTEEEVEVTIERSQLPYHFADQDFNDFGDYDIVIANVAGCDSTIHLRLNETEGIEDAGVLALLKVYPNPTSGRVQINAEQVARVEVLDLVGRCVAVFENTNMFDLTNLAAGTYTLRITLPEGTTLRKVVKR